MTGVCFASLDRFHGGLAAARGLAGNLGASWAVIPHDGAAPPMATEADVLVVSSWCPRYEALFTECRGVVVPYWRSTALDAAGSGAPGELDAVMAHLGRGDVAAVAVEDEHLATVLARPGVVHLPPLPPRLAPIAQPEQLTGVNVSLFGTGVAEQNLWAQVTAFGLLRRRTALAQFTLHLNGQTERHPWLSQWLGTLGAAYVDHGWLDRPRYHALVAGMDAGLCASLGRGYGYVAADHIGLGVPVVVSPGVTCLGGEAPRTQPDDIEAISRALSDCVADRLATARAQRTAFEHRARGNLTGAMRARHDILARASAHPVTRTASGRRLARFRELRLDRTGP